MKIKVEFEIDENELGEYLTCDDPETYPLVGCGFKVQDELCKLLGYTEEIERQLKDEAKRIGRRRWYERWIELTQQWAEKKLRR